MTIAINGVGTEAQRAAYSASVNRVLSQIRTTITGRNVLQHVEASQRRVRIEPYTSHQAAQFGAHNALTWPENVAGSGTLQPDRAAGGSNSIVSFTAGVSTMPGIQGSADEVLLHELCHALRQITGWTQYIRGPQGQRIRTPMRGGFDDVEEFFAVMVTNVHSSELGRPPLGNHRSAGLPSPEVLSVPPFSTRLARFRSQMPGFIGVLAAIPAQAAPFNPFATR